MEAVVRAVARHLPLSITPLEHELLDRQRSGAWRLGDQLLGYLGELSAPGLSRFQLRRSASVAELNLSLLGERARLVPRYQPLSPYPAVNWDRNVVFEDQVRWADIERVVHSSGGKELERVDYQETYRDEGRLGPGRKSVLFRITLRSHEGTLTRERVEEICQRIDRELREQLGGELRAV
jgi:phenylalanyl-tRNA synthetase beta chain